VDEDYNGFIPDEAEELDEEDAMEDYEYLET